MKNKFYGNTWSVNRLVLVTSFLFLSLLSQRALAVIPVTVTNNALTIPALAASYPDLNSALTALNTVAAFTGPGTVTLTLGGGSETAPSAAGFTIGSATLNPALLGGGNPIVINTSAASTLNAAVGVAAGSATAIQDGIIKIVGADYITLDGLTLVDGNTTNPAMMEYGIGMFKTSATDGAQFNTIKNCNITLNRENFVTGGTLSVDGSRGINIVNCLSTTQTTTITATAASGSNSNNKIYSNTIQNCNYGIALIGYAHGTPFTFADQNNDIGGSSALTGNIIKNYGGGTGSANPSAGIRTLAQYGINISYNTVNNNDGGGVNHPSTLRGIYLNTATSASATITFNTVTVKGGGTTSAVTAIDNVSGSTAASNTININNNTISGCTYSSVTTGDLAAIANTGTAATVNINNNIITGNTMGTIGVVGTCLYSAINSGGASTTSTANILNNTITGNTIFNAAGTLYCIRGNTNGWVVNGNTINNNSIPNTSGTGSAIVYGIYNLSSPISETYTNNNIDNLTVSGAGTSTSSIIRGIYTNTVVGSTNVTSGNNIHTLIYTAAGNCSVDGIRHTTGATINYFNNKICNLSSDGAGSIVTGIYLGGGVTATVYNNIIGDLRAPTANLANAVIGINEVSTTTTNTYNIYFNTVYLNASSSGALFGTSAVSVHTGPTVSLNNNIFVNTSTSNGAGLTVAYRRSSATLTSYGAGSDRNSFFAPVIFTDGVTPISVFAPGAGTYKGLVAPRDANSINENPPFLSTTCGNANFLHINTAIATGVESGGANIGSITNDYDADIRFGNPGYAGAGSAPDIGADEFEGIGIPPCAGTPPAGTISGIGALCSGTGTTLTLTGIPLLSGLSYQWSSSTTPGGPYTTTSGVGTSYATGNLTATTYFVVTTTCGNGGLSNTASEHTVVVNSLPAVSVSPTSAAYCSPTAGINLTASNALTYSWSPTTSLSASTGSTVIATPITNLVYTVTGTDANGCTGSATASITSSPAAVITNLTATPQNVCVGDNSVLAISGDVSAIAGYYQFSAANVPGAFVPIAGGTSVTTTVSVADFLGDTKTSTVIPLGFSFKFEGTTYTALKAMSDGFVSFNQAATSTLTQNLPAGTQRPLLAPLWDDLDGASTTGSASYITTGSPGSQVFTIEWINWQWNFAATAGTAQISFQVKLYEADGKIEFIYREESGTLNNPSASIGIAGVGTGNGNFLSLDGSGASPGVSAVTATNTIALKPATDQVYTFLPPSQAYTWSPSTFLSSTTGNTVTATTMTATTSYTVTATAVGGCTATSSITVSVGAALSCSALTSSVSSCFGLRTVTAHPIGGGAPYTYAWTEDGTSIAPTTQTITANPGSHTYNCLITDNCGLNCNAGDLAVSTNALPSVAVNPTTGLICNPGGVTVTLTASGASTYSWSPASGLDVATGNVVSANPSATTTYTISGTDGNGCVNTATAVITVNNTPYFTVSPASADICAGASIPLNVSDAFSSSYTYSTTITTPIAGTTTGVADPYPATLSVSGVPLGATLINVKLDGIAHINAQDMDILLQSPSGTNVILLSDVITSTDFTGLNLVLEDGAPALTTTTATSGTYSPTNTATTTDDWDAPGPGAFAQTGPTLAMFGNGNMNGVWNLFVDDDLSSSAGTIASWSLTFQLLSDPTVTYTWSPSSGLSSTTGLSVTATPASSTVYTVTGTSTGGCEQTGTFDIAVGSLLVCNPLTSTSPKCHGSDFTATAHPSGGGAPYSYAWSDGSTTSYPNAQTVTVNLTAGNYTLTCVVTDNCGTTCSSDVLVTVNALPAVAISPNTGLICNPGGSAVTLNATNGVSYTWSPSAGLSATTGANVSANPSVNTIYTVTGIDANGCVNTGTASITVGANPQIVANPISIDICNGASTVLDVNSTYLGTFIYNTVITTPIAGTTSGIADPYPAVLSVSGVPPGATLKSVSLNGIAHTLGADMDILLQSPTGVNVVLISDVITGVDFTGLDIVLEDGAPQLTTTTAVSGTYSPTNTAAGTTDDWAAPGPGAFAQIGPTLSLFGAGNMNGTWNLFVDDDAGGDIGSIASWSLTFEAPNDPSLTYTWSPAAGLSATTGTPVTATPAGTTIYTITATNAVSCTSTTTATVNVGAAIVCSAATVSPVAPCAGSDFTVTANVSGGGQPYTYSWSDGSTTVYPTTETITANLPAGSYTITCLVTDNCGETCTSSATVTVNPLPSLVVSPTSGLICNPGGAAITFNASGAIFYNVTPLNGVTQLTPSSASANPVSSTVYTVTGTDLNGCSNIATVDVQIGFTPAISAISATPPDICPNTFSQLSVTATASSAVVATQYSFSAGTGASLDPMTGATDILIGVTPVNAGIGDDDPIAPAPIGFDFVFEGVTYSSYSISPDGWIKLGSVAAVDDFTNGVTDATNIPKIYPIWDDFSIGTNGHLKGLLTGTSPNQIYILEWFINMPANLTGPANSTFQAWLYEGTNVIEFRYGTMGAATSASSGITGATSTNYQSITFSTNTSSNIAANNTLTVTPASGTIYTFTPPSFSPVTYSWNPAAGLKPNANVSDPETPGLLATTVYTVTATNNGCSSSATVTVHVEPLVCAPATHSAITCAGNNFNVTANHTGGGAPYTYAWSDGIGGVYPSSATITANLPAGIYGFECIVTDNCGNTCSSTVNITVNDSPTISVSQTSGQICNPSGVAVTLTASGGTGYSWSPSGGLSATTGTTVSALPASDATYTVVGTSVNGCTSSATAFIQVGYTPSGATVSATPSTICPGSTSQLDVTAGCQNSVIISEYQVYNIAGSGRTDPYPPHITASMADEFVEISNISTAPVDISGMTFQLWEGAALNQNWSFPSGTIIPSLSVAVVALKGGTDDPANLLFFTGVFENITSGVNHGLLIKQGSTIIDAVALNNHTWDPASGVTAADWSGCCLAPPATAGIERVAADDHNIASDWIVNNATDVQSIGFYNGGYTIQNCTFDYAWNPSSGLTPGPDVANPTTPALSATTIYTVTLSTNGCSSTSTVTVNVVVIDDNNPCTDDFCDTQTGTAFHTPVNVDDGDPCTTDGCDTNTGIFHTPNCGVTLNSSIFIQGYYSGGGLMINGGAGTLFVDGVIGAAATDADTVTISAMDPTPPYALVQEQQGILHTNGTISVFFTTPVIAGNSYYLKLFHRNSVETWSAGPVLMTPVTSYLFSSAASQAFNSNQADLGDGNFAIFSGDINHDGAVDGSDFLELDPSIQAGDGGYVVGDLNGDGAVDGSDFLVLDPNIQNGVGASLP